MFPTPSDSQQSHRMMVFGGFPKLGVPFKGGSILGLYRDNGKENGNYYLGFRD